MIYISSRQNSVVKEIKELKKRKNREEKGLFFIEGIRFVEEVFSEQVDILRFIISEKLENDLNYHEILSKIQQKDKEIYVVPHDIFEDMSDTENPQGIMAVIRSKYASLDEIMDKKNGMIIVLDEIMDPGNLGTIIRTADSAGADGIILSEHCVDLYNPKVLRATMGSIFHIPVFTSHDLLETIQLLKANGITIYASDMDGAKNCFDIDMTNPIALVIGNEANGIRPIIKEGADVKVQIPMVGRSESLNAGVAAGVFLYESLRQRKYKKM